MSRPGSGQFGKGQAPRPNAAEARATADHYLQLLDRIAAEGLDSNVSVKLTAMGQDIADTLCIENISRVLDRARELHPQRELPRAAPHEERVRVRVDDARLAASHFNWLVMSHALNEAMLLGDAAIPRPADLRRQAAAGVKVFLAAYGKR